jgi:hypothetical protein
VLRARTKGKVRVARLLIEGLVKGCLARGTLQRPCCCDGSRIRCQHSDHAHHLPRYPWLASTGGVGGMFKAVIDTVIGNLQLSISNVHIRCEGVICVSAWRLVVHAVCSMDPGCP